MTQAPSGPRWRRLAEGLFPSGGTLWTGLLITLNAAVYLGTVRRAGASLLDGPNALDLLRDGGVSAYTAVAGQQWWRVLTYQFLHAGLLHIGFNMYALLVLGPLAERLFGRARFLFVYLVGGAAGGALAAVARYAWYLHAGHVESLIEPTVGASGALLGLMGAILATTFKKDTRTNPALRTVVLRWVAFVFIAGFFFPADNLAHLGGLLGGFVCGWFLGESWRPNRLPSAAWAALSVALAGVVVASFYLALHRPPPFPIGVLDS